MNQYEIVNVPDCYHNHLTNQYSINGHTCNNSVNYSNQSQNWTSNKRNPYWSADYSYKDEVYLPPPPPPIQSNSTTPATTGVRCNNKYGIVTANGVDKIDSFLFVLRYYGFDLWMNRYSETGKRYTKRNRITKLLYLGSIMLINCQMFIHLAAILHIFLTKKKNFYNFLDDIRTFILKFTMTFAVDLWFLKSRSQSAMTHLVVVNYLLANKSTSLRRLSLRWVFVVIFFTVTHWAISQYWLSSMTVEEHRKWLNVVRCAMDNDWLVKRSFFTVAVLRSIATIDSYVYRMFIYGSRFAVMCAYCLLSMLLAKCICQVNDLLTDHLNSEYHYHHVYCKRAVQRRNRNRQYPNKQNDVKFNFELFKEQFNVIYRMHLEIEQCFGPLNFIWFGSLFIVSCIDIFFLVWSAGSEWFRVWSFLEFTSMVVLWAPHFLVAYFASRVSFESRRMKLHLKELCRQDEEIRDILVSSVFYPRIKPTLNGVVQLDIGFFLSFICTLVTFSVMLIQLNPDAVAKVG